MLPARPDNAIELRRLVRESIGDAKSDRWFGTQTCVSFDGSIVAVHAATSYLLKHLQRHYHNLLTEIGTQLVGKPIELHWNVDETLASVAAPATKTATQSHATAIAAEPDSKRKTGPHDLGRFVVGDCNRVPFNATEMLAKMPLGMTDIMVLFGPVGSGKTHLLEGMAAKVRSGKSVRTMTINGPTFGNLFKQAMSEYSTASFRQRFQSVDLLCVDDLDFFESKKSFQDELLQLIERIQARGGTVVVTASLHPKMLTGLSDVLVSRLVSGPVCRIEKPSQSVRRQVAAVRAKSLEADITADAVRYAADRFSTSVREVIGAVNTLHTHTMASGERITLAKARQVLTSLERDVAKVVRIAEIEAAVARLFGLPPMEMRSARRSRTVSQPRQVAMYLARKLTNEAYKEIGSHFGGRNHSTVMAAERQVRKMLDKHDVLKIGFQEMPVDEVVARLEEQIRVG